MRLAFTGIGGAPQHQVRIEISGRNDSDSSESCLSISPDQLATRLLSELTWLEETIEKAAASANGRVPPEDVSKFLQEKAIQLTDIIDLSEKLAFLNEGDFVEIEADPHLNRIPFEMMDLAGVPLALRNSVSRKLMLQKEAASTRSDGASPIRSALIITSRNPKPKLILEVERIQVRNTLEKSGVIVNDWQSAIAPENDDLAHLGSLIQDADIVHFSGHLKLEGGKAKFQLDGEAGTWLSVSDFEKMGMNPSLVWLSTCHGAVISDVQSFAEAVLCRDASVCIGASLPVADHTIAMACEKFYRELFAGCPAGQAMLECRLQLKSMGSTAWATTLLFGDPRWRVSVSSKKI